MVYKEKGYVEGVLIRLNTIHEVKCILSTIKII